MLVLVALALVMGGCSTDDESPAEPAAVTERPAPEPDPTASTAPADFVVEPIEWEACDAEHQCATVAVPLDHDEPTGETIEVGVARLPAQGERIGALFANFGGPGGDAAGTIGSFGWPATIRDRFDIVGMDPRGVGTSTPLDCGVDARELYAADPTIEDESDVEELLAVSRAFAADCAEQRGELLEHLGTNDVARDMDLVRRAMGDDQLSFLGYSYGTSIGQAYAELFGEHTRAMILDGVVDPAPTGIEVAVEQARGFEAALAAWAADCPNRPTCELEDPIAAVDEMLAAAEDELPGGQRPFGPGEAAIGLAYPLYAEFLWPDLDRAVSAALDGEGAPMVALADDYASLVDFSIYFAVSCLDSTWPTDTDRFLAEAERAAEVAPRFGEAIVNDYIRCAVWPAPPDPVGAVDAADAPPILVISTTGDAATPYENGVVVADRLESGVLLTNVGDSHTVAFQGDECVDEIAIDYLVDLELPTEGARC